MWRVDWQLGCLLDPTRLATLHAGMINAFVPSDRKPGAVRCPRPMFGEAAYCRLKEKGYGTDYWCKAHLTNLRIWPNALRIWANTQRIWSIEETCSSWSRVQHLTKCAALCAHLVTCIFDQMCCAIDQMCNTAGNSVHIRQWRLQMYNVHGEKSIIFCILTDSY